MSVINTHTEVKWKMVDNFSCMFSVLKKCFTPNFLQKLSKHHALGHPPVVGGSAFISGDWCLQVWLGFARCKIFKWRMAVSEKRRHQSQTAACSTSATYFWFVLKQTLCLHAGPNQPSQIPTGGRKLFTFHSIVPEENVMFKPPLKVSLGQKKKKKNGKSNKKSCAWYRASGWKRLWLIAAFRHPAGSEGRRGASAKRKKDTASTEFVREAQLQSCFVCIRD